MTARIAFWLLLPVSAVQGLWLRWKATRLPGAEGERAGVVGEGEKLYFLAIGDSIIDGVGTARVDRSLPGQFARALADHEGRRVHWRIEGKSGFAIQDVIERIHSLDHTIPADHILISVGVNNVTGLSSTRYWEEKLEELFALLHLHWPPARIIFAGLPPMSRFPLPPQPLRFTLGMRAARLDDIAAVVISRFPNAVHIPTAINPDEHDFCEDGFHPSAESCTIWAREIVRLTL